MTNSLTYISLAYKAAALQLMMGEANFASQKLNLPTPHPIEARHMTTALVSPPKFGFGGTVGTTNYVFSFGPSGVMHSLCRMENGENFLSIDRQKQLANVKPTIDTSGAYTLATQWLSAVSVDVAALEKKHKPETKQRFLWNPPGSTNKIMLPIYDVNWGAVNVVVLGTTKELMEIYMRDTSFSKRPVLAVTNAAELMSRPDPPKALVTPKEREQIK